MPRAPLALAFASLLLVPASLAGCGDDDEQPARNDTQTTSTPETTVPQRGAPKITVPSDTCLLYTSDAADE